MRQISNFGVKMGWAGGLHETAERQLSSASTQWSAWKKQKSRNLIGQRVKINKGTTTKQEEARKA